MILYYINESLKIFKRTKLASVVTVITTVIALFFVSFSISLIFLSGKITEEVKERVEINLFLNDSLNTSQIKSIQSKLEKDPITRSVYYISKDDAKRNFINETGEDFSSVLELNPLPASFVVRFKTDKITTNNFAQIKNRYKDIAGISDIVFDYSTVLKILKIITSFRIYIYIFSLIFVCFSVYLVFSINKLQLNSRKYHLDTMKLVGAKLSTIKIPLLLNGALIGAIASVISIIVYNVALFLAAKFYTSLRITEYFYLINIWLLILGIFLGILGSYLAVRNINLKIERI